MIIDLAAEPTVPKPIVWTETINLSKDNLHPYQSSTSHKIKISTQNEWSAKTFANSNITRTTFDK